MLRSAWENGGGRLRHIAGRSAFFCLLLWASGTARANGLLFSFGAVNGTTVPAAAQAAFNLVGQIFSSEFTDINATIDVEWGTPAGVLGQSSTPFDTIDYATYIAALTADARSADDFAAVSTLPASAPIGNGTIRIKPPNERAIGLTPTAGANISGFDGVISFSDTANWFFRDGGSISGNQFDFVTIAEHEIDEVLGTASFLDNILAGGLDPAGNPVRPADLFRYDSSGRSYTISPTAAAYFSVNGTTLLAQYNQTGSGDFGDWASTGSCPPDTPRVQNGIGCQGVSVDLGVEIRLLDVIGYDRAVSEPPTMAAEWTGLAALLCVGYGRRRKRRA